MPKNKVKLKNKGYEEVAKEKIYEGIEELKKMLNQAKVKFDNADGKTKKQIVIGIAGSLALIAGAVGIGKALKNKRNK